MGILDTVHRAVAWIDQAENQAFQLPGSYANGGRVSELRWMRKTLTSAPSEALQRDLIEHWTGTGALPHDLLEWDK
jgi:hypothetical protein